MLAQAQLFRLIRHDVRFGHMNVILLGDLGQLCPINLARVCRSIPLSAHRVTPAVVGKGIQTKRHHITLAGLVEEDNIESSVSLCL